MQGGTVSSVDVRDAGGPVGAAKYFSRQTTIAVFVAVIALVFHVTGSTGPGAATVNQSVLVLAVLIAQVTMPRRHLSHLFSAPTHDTRSPANAQLAASWPRRRDDPQRVRFCGYTVSPRASIATNWLIRRSRVAGSLASLIRKRIA